MAFQSATEALDRVGDEVDTIRVIVEHRRESPIALFYLDSRPHLKLVHVPPTDIGAYASLLETEVTV